MSSTTPAFRPMLDNKPGKTAGVVEHVLNMPLVSLIGYVALFSIAFGNLIDVEADNQSVGFGGQALVKVMFLALGGLYGGIGVLTDAKVRRLLLSFPMMWMSLILFFFLVAIPTSVTVFTSFASTISIACVLLLTTTALVQIGVKNVLNTVFYAAAAYVLGSWVAYFFVPDIGVFLEATSEGQFVHRMGGLSHPNTLGQVSGFTLVLSVLLFRDDKKFSWVRAIVIVAAAAALVGSLSKTSMIASVIAVMYVYRMHIFQRRYALMVIVFGIVGLATLMLASMVIDIEAKVSKKLGALSKSGDAAELTSATGRTEIWAETIDLVAQRPVVGFGAATSKELLKDYSLHTHNLVLNVALSTGVFGGALCLWMCLNRFFNLFLTHHPIADSLVVFVLVNGLFENVIFSILCGLPTMIWIIALALPTLDTNENQEKTPDPSTRILKLSRN